MSIYIGFQKPNSQYVEWMNNKFLEGELPLPGESHPYGMGNGDPRLNEIASGFPAFLEKKGIKLIGRYNPVGSGAHHSGNHPGILIIDTDNDQDLNAIMNYYTPFIDISFRRYNSRY
ncbi:MAG: hypothetical protein CL787_00465 [Chloroflexi bacterium]|nr:hypothetical protein [Chloroflexota bacterium]MQF99557.1 hypothetical protein [SAR202 cluster bacterium]